MILGGLALCNLAFGDVYMLSGGNNALDLTTEAVLESYGHSVTIGPTWGSFTGTGSQSLSGYKAVLFLANYGWDLSGGAPDVLYDFVNSGGGLVTGEWVNYNASLGRLGAVADVLATTTPRTSNGNSPITYTAVEADPILNAGLPDAFTFTADNIGGGTEDLISPKSGAHVFYDSSNLDGGLIGWEYGAGAGHTISFSTVIGPLELANPEYSRLLSNALTWAGDNPAVVPVPGAVLLGALGLSVAGWRLRRTTA